jgi:hypothetical protein
VLNLPVYYIFSSLGNLIETILSALENQIAQVGLLPFFGFYAMIFLIIATPLVFMFGRMFEAPGVPRKIGAVLLALTVLVFGFVPLIMFSFLFSIMVVLLANFVSGTALLGARKSPINIAMFSKAITALYSFLS